MAVKENADLIKEVADKGDHTTSINFLTYDLKRIQKHKVSIKTLINT